jgi:hypothetical protein
MSDDVTVDNGSGTDYDVATDDDGSGNHLQLVKLAYSANGSRTPVVADATGLAVTVQWADLKSGGSPVGFSTGDDHSTGGSGGVVAMGVNQGDAVQPLLLDTDGNLRVKAHRDLLRIAVTSAGLTTATTAYVAGDQVGTQFTIANAARISGGSGTLIGLELTSAADIIGAYDLVLTRASITLASDNAAYAISDADALNVIGVVQMYTVYDITNNRVAQAWNLAIPYDCSGGTSLYGGLVNRAGHTFFGATTDLQLTAWVERN